jgi:hypothetical protein
MTKIYYKNHILLLFSIYFWSSSLVTKNLIRNQLLLCSVVIGARLSRKDYSSIHRNYDREKTITTWCPNWTQNQIMRSSGPNTGGKNKNKKSTLKMNKCSVWEVWTSTLAYIMQYHISSLYYCIKCLLW